MTQCKRWNVVSVPVQSAEPEDTREESYKIAGSGESRQEAYSEVEQVGRLSKTERIQLVDSLAGDCTVQLNNRKKSLGIAKPESIVDFDLKPTETDSIQVTLDNKEIKGKNDYPHKLYVDYRCENCSLKGDYHQQHCIEWGVYKYWDNHDDHKGVTDALHLDDDDWEHYFFVGNMNHQRTSYIIISDLRFKKKDLLKAGVADEQATFGDY